MRPTAVILVVAVLASGCRSSPPARLSPPCPEVQILSGDQLRVTPAPLEEAQQIQIVLFEDDGDRVPQPTEVLESQTIEFSGKIGSFQIGPLTCLQRPIDDLCLQVTRTTVSRGEEVSTRQVLWPTE